MKYFILLVLIFLSSCSFSDKSKLDYSLNLANENRMELEEVLKYYQEMPQQFAAAKFIIENMPGHYGYDYQSISKLQPIYDQLFNISKKHNWERNIAWRNEIDIFWESRKNNVCEAFKQQDIYSIKANWLIREIDIAFKAWKENEYSKNIPFKDFCMYILPYRFQEGICLDDARYIFYHRHANYFNDTTKCFKDVVDSLSNKYNHLQFNNMAAAALPIYNTATFEYLKRGTCYHMAWYNTLLFSSLGMPVTIDFVPQWGNRNGAHCWNALIINGNTYPFEPFYDKDRWKYKQTYNNKNIDPAYGKFKLPKVYRYTFEYHTEGPMFDKQTSTNDIPKLFQNCWIKDVSSEYFKTTDISIDITENIPNNTNYCYLCVYSSNGWIPVQWGKISKNKLVVFKKMGRGIAYLPAFFKNGVFIPAAPLFILTQDNTVKQQLCINEKKNITVRTPGPYFYENLIEQEKHKLVGGNIVGCNNLNSLEYSSENLCSLTDTIDLWENDIKLSPSNSYRYIRFIPPSDTIALCEMTFFEHQNGKLVQIPNVHVYAEVKSLKKEETLNMITDNLSSTGFYGVFKNNIQRRSGIIFDLGKHSKIEQISFIPYTQSCIDSGIEYKLYYWDNAWISSGTVIGHNNMITFIQVPQNTMYRIKNPIMKERIFTYDNGIINWY